jgi:hypothetical protein
LQIPHSYHTGYQWVSLKRHDKLPLNSVLGGYDNDGSKLYVGRFWHEDNVLPAKIVASNQSEAAFVSAAYNGQEISSRYFQVIFILLKYDECLY